MSKQWHDVNDRLPEVGEAVHGFYPNGYDPDGRHIEEIVLTVFLAGDGSWQLVEYGEMASDIYAPSHWTELLKAPNVKEVARGEAT